MAIISFNQSAKGESDSITIKGNEEELEKIIDYVKHMYDKKTEQADSNEDVVNHPSHYEHGIECIDEMVLLYGKEEAMSFCKLNMHKYRKRAFDKGGKVDLDKSDWYMKEYTYLNSKMEIDLLEEIYDKYKHNLNN